VLVKAPKYVIAPEGCSEYLTPGRRYEVRSAKSGQCEQGRFRITTDMGLNASCRFNECPHLNGGDWIIPDEAEAPADDDRRFVAACHAMQGMGTWMPDYNMRPVLSSDEAIEARAEWAVRQADALLAALAGKDGK